MLGDLVGDSCSIGESQDVLHRRAPSDEHGGGDRGVPLRRPLHQVELVPDAEAGEVWSLKLAGGP